MGYIYDFDIGSIFFFALTMYFYLSRRRLRNLQDSIYTAMLIASMVAVVFDFTAAAIEYHAMLHPVWLIYVVNLLFIFGMQSCLPLFFLYSVATSGKFKSLSPLKTIAALSPYITVMALLLLSPFVSFGICYVDAAHIYHHGPTHMVLYINTVFYVLAGVIVLLRNSHRMQRKKRNVMLIFVVILFMSIVLQVLFARYLLTASATALALTSLYYVLQSPVDQINPFTGAFSRTMLGELLQDYTERGIDHSLIVIALRSFDGFIRLYGDAAGLKLLRAYSDRLMKRFPNDVVIFMDTSEFIVVRQGILPRAEMERLCAEVPASITADAFELPLSLSLGLITYSVGADSTADTMTADYMLRQMRAFPSSEVIYADDEYKAASAAAIRLEASLESILNNGNFSLSASDILGADEIPVLTEFRLVPPTGAAGNIGCKNFIEAAGQCGYAWQYYDALFGTLSTKRQTRSGVRSCIPVISAAFTHEDSAERMLRLISNHGFEPNELVFCVTEAEMALSLSVVSENVKQLQLLGFGLLLDDFAEDYTDMTLLISLSPEFVRFGGDIVKSALNDERSFALLGGLLEMLSDTGTMAVCSGLDGDDEKAVAVACGAKFTQLEGDRICIS